MNDFNIDLKQNKEKIKQIKIFLGKLSTLCLKYSTLIGRIRFKIDFCKILVRESFLQSPKYIIKIKYKNINIFKALFIDEIITCTFYFDINNIEYLKLLKTNIEIKLEDGAIYE